MPDQAVLVTRTIRVQGLSLTIVVEDPAGPRREGGIVQASTGVDALELPSVDRGCEVGCRVGDVSNEAETGRERAGRVMGNNLARCEGNCSGKAGSANSDKGLEQGHDCDIGLKVDVVVGCCRRLTMAYVSGESVCIGDLGDRRVR